jgi:hypothetical protein
MAPRGRKPSSPLFTHPSRAVKVAIDVAEFYEDTIPEADNARMTELEEEVHQIRQFHEDKDMEAQVGSFIPDLGCTRTQNSKFYKTLALHWHTKTMVTLGMLPRSKTFVG